MVVLETLLKRTRKRYSPVALVRAKAYHLLVGYHEFTCE